MQRLLIIFITRVAVFIIGVDIQTAAINNIYQPHKQPQEPQLVWVLV